MKEFIQTIKKLSIKYKYDILVIVISILILNIPLPYYIYAPGGISNVDSRYELENEYLSSGSFNLVYVTSYEANIATYLVTLVNPSWELVKENEVLYEEEDSLDLYNRDLISLEAGGQNAIINAYKRAGKEYIIEGEHLYVIYIDEIAETDLEVGDEIIKIDNQTINSFDHLSNYIDSKANGDTVKIKVIRFEQEIEVSAKINQIDGEKIIGIIMDTLYDLKTNPKIEIDFEKDEVGGSAGMMLALSIYDSLIKEDLTHGYKIAGTGAIDELGNIEEIGSVDKKLASAVKARADIFLVPKGDNYKEAKKLASKKGYKIIIKDIADFEEAVTYLENLKVGD